MKVISESKCDRNKNKRITVGAMCGFQKVHIYISTNNATVNRKWSIHQKKMKESDTCKPFSIKIDERVSHNDAQ